MKWSESHSVVSDSWQPHGLYSPWNSLGQNTRVGSCSLLQGIFPTQGSNPGLPHCRWILYQLSHKGNPRILEWVAYPFSSRSSGPRSQTGVSCILLWVLMTLAVSRRTDKVFCRMPLYWDLFDAFLRIRLRLWFGGGRWQSKVQFSSYQENISQNDLCLNVDLDRLTWGSVCQVSSL